MGAKFSLSGKHAVVTGGANGIGKAIVENFVEAGAKLFVLDILKEDAYDNPAPDEVQYFQCNIGDTVAVRETFDQIHNQGRIDILVNNAGIAHVGNVEDTDEEDFVRVMQVNVFGMYHCLKACVTHMKADGGGAIVNIASTLSSMAIPNRFAYCTSKGAVLPMTYSVALDYIDYGIRCNAISPGRVHTPFVDGFIARNYPGREKEMFEKLSTDHPIGRMAKPSEIADMALYLCSDEAAFVTGSNHSIDGGFTHLVRN